MINQVTNNSDRNLFAPLRSNGVYYAISKPFTPLQKFEEKQEEEKQVHKRGYGIAKIVLLAGFGVLLLMKGLPKSFRAKAGEFFKSIEKKASKLKKTEHQLSGMQKFYLGVLNKTKPFTKFLNTALNFAPLKDILLKRATDKSPFMAKICDKITDVFERIAVKTSTRAYRRTTAKFEKLYEQFAHANVSIPKEKLTQIETRIAEFKVSYGEDFGANTATKRLLEIKEKLNGLPEDLWRRTFGNPKGFVKARESYTTFITEELASKPKADLLKEVTSLVADKRTKIEDIMKIYQGLLSPEEYAKLKKIADKSLKSLDKSSHKETDKLFDKLRDLKVGSAPTDFLSIITALGAVGWGLTKAENKDERISAGLKYGIPAFGSVAIALLCTVSLVSAGPSLLIGLFSGVLINKLGTFVDDKRKQNQ